MHRWADVVNRLETLAALALETRTQVGRRNSRSARSPTSRRYGPEAKAAALQIVGRCASNWGASRAPWRGAGQLGCGMESTRTWMRQDDIDNGYTPGVSATAADCASRSMLPWTVCADPTATC